MKRTKSVLLFVFGLIGSGYSQPLPISHFVSLGGAPQSANMVLPDGYHFQKLAKQGENYDGTNSFRSNFDFTGFVPNNGSSSSGVLSINHENLPGGVTLMDINFDETTRRWSRSNVNIVDFNPVVNTAVNCSGTVTPWNSIITCEEVKNTADANLDGYNDFGWAIEIDPITKTVKNNQKLWAMGCFAHENVVIHKNRRTVYQGADSNPGYLFKFVATHAENLSDGILYVYKGSKNGTGAWIVVPNSTKTERNNVLQSCSSLGATTFAGIEDVEISPIDSSIYLAVKGESQVYRLQDTNPINGTTVSSFGTYVGGGSISYTLETTSGLTSEAWGSGNDNLAFDDLGNLWVLQDGSRNHLWVVAHDHSPAEPKVKIFMRTPTDSEPTGLTFSPDYRFMFMSIQHPSGNVFQSDVSNNLIKFDASVAMVIARNEVWNGYPCNQNLAISTIDRCCYFSSEHINASANISSTLNVKFQAAKSIELNPGFYAQNGTLFTASLKGCQ